MRIVKHQAGRARHEMRAVEDAERILRLELDGLETGIAQRVPSRPPFPLPPDGAIADQHQAHMGRRSQVAAGAQRTLLRYPGADVVVQQVDEPLGNRWAYPRGTLTELVHPDQH